MLQEETFAEIETTDEELLEIQAEFHQPSDFEDDDDIEHFYVSLTPPEISLPTLLDNDHDSIYGMEDISWESCRQIQELIENVRKGYRWSTISRLMDLDFNPLIVSHTEHLSGQDLYYLVITPNQDSASLERAEDIVERFPDAVFQYYNTSPCFIMECENSSNHQVSVYSNNILYSTFENPIRKPLIFVQDILKK